MAFCVDCRILNHHGQVPGPLGVKCGGLDSKEIIIFAKVIRIREVIHIVVQMIM